MDVYAAPSYRAFLKDTRASVPEGQLLEHCLHRKFLWIVQEQDDIPEEE